MEKEYVNARNDHQTEGAVKANIFCFKIACSICDNPGSSRAHIIRSSPSSGRSHLIPASLHPTQCPSQMAPNPSFSDRRRKACFFVSKLIEGGGVALVTLISVLWEILFKKETLRRDGSSVDNSPKSLADRNKAEVCRDPWTIDPVQIRLHEYQNKWNKEYWNFTCAHQYSQVRLKFTLQNRSQICWTRYFGFLTLLSALELELNLGPSIVREPTLLDDAVRMNHFPGFEKN